MDFWILSDLDVTVGLFYLHSLAFFCRISKYQDFNGKLPFLSYRTQQISIITNFSDWFVMAPLHFTKTTLNFYEPKPPAV